MYLNVNATLKYFFNIPYFTAFSEATNKQPQILRNLIYWWSEAYQMNDR